jgi:hypothetical protein
MRTTEHPAVKSARRPASDQQAGPSVQMMWVDRVRVASDIINGRSTRAVRSERVPARVSGVPANVVSATPDDLEPDMPLAVACDTTGLLSAEPPDLPVTQITLTVLELASEISDRRVIASRCKALVSGLVCMSSMPYIPKLPSICRKVCLFVDATKIMHGGRYFAMSRAARPDSETQMMHAVLRNRSPRPCFELSSAYSIAMAAAEHNVLSTLLMGAVPFLVVPVRKKLNCAPERNQEERAEQ